ncbi:hypothetical protein LzC2_30720 [Planctomycetes bacterium LzC2]|uniref:SURF1-like protein n=1 Tax=Alienimonas chondri TaxID=2681879 RepID=A0ABX1VHK6_9PLAN|nr:hypothetical protein [Alienimonas chondri]
MRVRPHRRPAPYLNGADQRRMLAMVGSLGLVLFAASWAADPANWYWIAPPKAVPADDGEAPDFSVREDAPLPPGTVRVAMASADEPSDEPADDGAAAETTDERLPESLTAGVKDRTVGLTRKERDAVAAIRERFSDDPPSLAPEADAVSFPALMRDPTYYRGRPVRVFGEARGITDLGEGRGVSLWVFAPDAGDNPVHVRANRAEGLPRGEMLREPVPVTVDGVFFKLEGYTAKGENGEGRLHVAPLIIADEVNRARIAAAVPQTPEELPWIVLGVIVAALAGGALLVWRWKAADRDYERTTLSRLSAAADAQGELLNFSADDATPETFLAGISGNEPASPGSPPTGILSFPVWRTRRRSRRSAPSPRAICAGSTASRSARSNTKRRSATPAPRTGPTARAVARCVG